MSGGTVPGAKTAAVPPRSRAAIDECTAMFARPNAVIANGGSRDGEEGLAARSEKDNQRGCGIF